MILSLQTEQHLEACVYVCAVPIPNVGEQFLCGSSVAVIQTCPVSGDY